MRFGLLLALLLVFAAGCGGSNDTSANDLPPPPQRKAGVLPTIQKSTAVPTAVADTYNSDSLITNYGNLVNAISFCNAHPAPTKDATNACIAQQMMLQNTAPAALAFFNETGYWLVGFQKTGRMDMANVLAPDLSAVPQIAFLGPARQMQLEADLRAGKYPNMDSDHQSPFRDAPEFAAVQAAAQVKFRNADDPLDLREFNDAMIESVSPQVATPGFVVEVGISNFCKNCGIGVAARYSLQFDDKGKLTSMQLMGLCQGRQVTRDVTGGRSATFHEFSGLRANANGTYSEPYFLPVSGLKDCPQHLDF